MDRWEILAFGRYRLEVAARRLLCGEAVVPVTARVFDLLVALVRNSDRVVSKAELMQVVWSDAVVEDHNLKQSISVLRKVLGDSAREPRYIATIPARGYRFVAAVEEVGRSPLPMPTVEPLKRTKARASAVAAVLAATILLGAGHPSPLPGRSRGAAVRATHANDCGCENGSLSARSHVHRTRDHAVRPGGDAGQSDRHARGSASH